MGKDPAAKRGCFKDPDEIKKIPDPDERDIDFKRNFRNGEAELVSGLAWVTILS